jgi:hypothetical protein
MLRCPLREEGIVAREDMVMASQEELKRLHVVRKVQEKLIKQVEAGEILGLSLRQIRRMVKRVGEEGHRGIVHRSRGRLSNRAFSGQVKDRVIELYR